MANTCCAMLTLLQDGLHLLPGLADGPICDDVTGAIRTSREVRVISVWVEMDWPVHEVYYSKRISQRNAR